VRAGPSGWEKQGCSYWAATESQNLVFQPSRIFPSRPAAGDVGGSGCGGCGRAGWIEVSGPVTAEGLAGILGLAPADILDSLIRLEGEGLVLRGFFSDSGEEEFCDRRILARIHRATIAHLRREIDPVPAAVFLRFLIRNGSMRHRGTQACGRTRRSWRLLINSRGFETAAAAWEGGNPAGENHRL